MSRLPAGFVLLLVLSIVIRVWTVSISFQFRENTDVLRYKDWARIGYLDGFAETYTGRHLSFGSLGNNQPPGSVYVLTGAYQTELAFAKAWMKLAHIQPGENLFINGPLVSIFLRLPSIVSDIGIGIIIYLILQQLGASLKWKLIASSLFLLNPIIIYNSSFWGQMDSVNNFFFVLSLFFLVKKKYFFTVVCFFLSLYIKFSLIFLLPFLLLVLYKWGVSLKRLFLYPVISWFLLCVLTFPVNKNPFVWLALCVQTASGEMQQITNFAFNFWWVVFHPHIISMGSAQQDIFQFSDIRLLGSPEVSETLWGMPLLLWSAIPLALVFVFLFYRVFRARRLSPAEVFLVMAVVSVLGFLFIPRMHERYLYPVFAPLALYVGMTRKFVWVLLLLSVVHMINLYWVWHPFSVVWLPLWVMDNQLLQWCVAFVTVVIGIGMYLKTVKVMKSES